MQIVCIKILEFQFLIIYLVHTSFYDINAHLAGISCLQLDLDTVEFPPEPVLGARINHLAPYLCGIRRPKISQQRNNLHKKQRSKVFINVLVYDLEINVPRDEEDLALLTVIICDEVKVVHGIAALVGRQVCSEVIVSLLWQT